MKIETSVSFSSMNGMEEKPAVLRGNNFDYCRLISWSPNAWTDENAAALKALIEKNGVNVSAFRCGWGRVSGISTPDSLLLVLCRRITAPCT